MLLGGVNAVAVRVAVGELGPLWSATLRFGIAAAVLLAIATLTRTPLPRGRALTGSILYGTLGFAGAFGCIHWALVRVPPAYTQTILALVPLLTFLFAVGTGLERFRAASLAGGLIAFGGIAVIFGERLGASTPLLPLLAAVAGAACMAGGQHRREALPGLPSGRVQRRRDDGRGGDPPGRFGPGRRGAAHPERRADVGGRRVHVAGGLGGRVHAVPAWWSGAGPPPPPAT